jgi:hypothetical protein
MSLALRGAVLASVPLRCCPGAPEYFRVHALSGDTSCTYCTWWLETTRTQVPHSSAAWLPSLHAQTMVVGLAGPVRLLPSAVQPAQLCAAFPVPRYSPVLRTPAQPVTCSAARQMSASAETTTSLPSLTVDRVPCLSARCPPLGRSLRNQRLWSGLCCLCHDSCLHSTHAPLATTEQCSSARQ